MPRRHSTKTLPPFPPDINRAYFGAWLSGLVDGEGTFVLWRYLDKRYGTKRFDNKAAFAIVLRADDEPALRLVMAYLKCGRLHRASRILHGNESPQVKFEVDCIQDLITTVIPHFENNQLLCKKGRDFEIWKRGVDLIHKVSLRPVRACGYRGSHLRRWTQEENTKFAHLCSQLKVIRKYNAPPVSHTSENADESTSGWLPFAD